MPPMPTLSPSNWLRLPVSAGMLEFLDLAAAYIVRHGGEADRAERAAVADTHVHGVAPAGVVAGAGRGEAVAARARNAGAGHDEAVDRVVAVTAVAGAKADIGRTGLVGDAEIDAVELRRQVDDLGGGVEITDVREWPGRLGRRRRVIVDVAVPAAVIEVFEVAGHEQGSRAVGRAEADRARLVGADIAPFAAEIELAALPCLLRNRPVDAAARAGRVVLPDFQRCAVFQAVRGDAVEARVEAHILLDRVVGLLVVLQGGADEAGRNAGAGNDRARRRYNRVGRRAAEPECGTVGGRDRACRRSGGRVVEDGPIGVAVGYETAIRTEAAVQANRDRAGSWGRGGAGIVVRGLGEAGVGHDGHDAERGHRGQQKLTHRNPPQFPGLDQRAIMARYQSGRHAQERRDRRHHRTWHEPTMLTAKVTSQSGEPNFYGYRGTLLRLHHRPGHRAHQSPPLPRSSRKQAAGYCPRSRLLMPAGCKFPSHFAQGATSAPRPELAR